jgi:asparagine synthetase B (glutamine-hydrolysing)
MITKIIGFLISKEDVKPEVDFFDVGIKIICIKHAGYNIYLWGMGNLKEYKIHDQYSLSFPLHDNLLDRNILISFEGESILVENDWLGSIPVFYNTKEQIISTLSNLCLKDKTIDNEGLSNFCEFGYSVFEQTVFRDVKFMRYYSKLIISNFVDIEYKSDPVLDECFLTNTSNEESVIAKLQEYISKIESNTEGKIILPTSGGYDSRILNYFIKDKSRIKSFTYGISQDQSVSTEVAHAKRISEIYNTSWEQVKLDKFHQHIDKSSWHVSYRIL